MTAPRTADIGFARLDLDRAARTGTPEVVYAAGKTPAQTIACLAALLDGGASLAFATRVDEPTAAAVLERWPEALVDADGPGGVRRRAARARGRGAGALGRHVRRPGRGGGRRDAGRPRGRLPPGRRRRCGRRAPGGRGRRRPGRRGRGRRRRGHGRRAARGGRRADRPAGRGGADVGRLRRRVRGSGAAADHAHGVRAGRRRRQHRQRLRRRRGRRQGRASSR